MNKIDKMIYDILSFSMGVDEKVNVIPADNIKNLTMGFVVYYVKDDLEYYINPQIRLADLKRELSGSSFGSELMKASGRSSFASYLEKCVNSKSEMQELKNIIMMNEALE